MTQTLKIGVSKDPPNEGIVSCRRIAIRERLLRFLLGKKRKLTIIIPGDNVKSLSIVEEGGNPDEPNEPS